MKKPLALFALALAAIVLRGFPFANPQSIVTNEVSGRVIDGHNSAPGKNVPLNGMVVNFLTPKDELQVSAKTDVDGKFKASLELSVRYYRLMVYDPQDQYWPYASVDPTPNDKKQYDRGDIPLYPQSKRLSDSELTGEYLIVGRLKASHVKADQDAGKSVEARLQKGYPEAYAILSRTNDARAQGIVLSLVRAEITFKSSTGQYGNLDDLLGYGLIDDMGATGSKLGYKFYVQRDHSDYYILALPTEPGVTGKYTFAADSSGNITALAPTTWPSPINKANVNYVT